VKKIQLALVFGFVNIILVYLLNAIIDLLSWCMEARTGMLITWLVFTVISTGLLYANSEVAK
jgi:hypothetical protein